MRDDSHQSDPHRRARLRWRARRGLLENDIIFERFFSKYEHDLTDVDAGALSSLLDLSDNDLMDLLLACKEPEGDLSRYAKFQTRILIDEVQYMGPEMDFKYVSRLTYACLDSQDIRRLLEMLRSV